jgi:hypothetical protein
MSESGFSSGKCKNIGAWLTMDVHTERTGKTPSIRMTGAILKYCSLSSSDRL